MTEINTNLDHIKKSITEATQGPWVLREKIYWGVMVLGEFREPICQLWTKNEELMKNDGHNGYLIANAPTWLSSLIATIESQNSQIESLKAITELAVKGLKYYANQNNYGTENLSLHGFIPIDDDGGLMARTTLEVIEQRLSHE